MLIFIDFYHISTNCWNFVFSGEVGIGIGTEAGIGAGGIGGGVSVGIGGIGAGGIREGVGEVMHLANFLLMRKSLKVRCQKQ